jgi:hypothetical protein
MSSNQPNGASGIDPSTRLNSLFLESESNQRQQEEARRRAEETARRQSEQAAARERLAEAFDNACSFQRWPVLFVMLGDAMRECDEAIDGLRLRDRLRAVAGKPSPLPMRFAIKLLLLASAGKDDAIAGALKTARSYPALRRFPCWLPFILDSLWPPVNGPVATPPDDITPEESRQAEQAFGWKVERQEAEPVCTFEDTFLTADYATSPEELRTHCEALRHRTIETNPERRSDTPQPARAIVGQKDAVDPEELKAIEARMTRRHTLGSARAIIDRLWDTMRRLGGRVPEQPHVRIDFGDMLFGVEGVDEAIEAFHRAIDTVVAWCEDRIRVGEAGGPEAPEAAEGDLSEDHRAVRCSGQWIEFGRAPAQKSLFAWCLKNNGRKKAEAMQYLGLDEQRFQTNLHDLRKSLDGRLRNCEETVSIDLDGSGTITVVKYKKPTT